MKVVFKSYSKEETIPVYDAVSNRKIAKYFSRETEAAVVCVKELLNGKTLSPLTPFYYAYCLVEFENYGLGEVAGLSGGDKMHFSHKNFIQKGMPSISPLTQFKILCNMTLSFLCIEHGLKGDNAVIYSSASDLIQQVIYSPYNNTQILIGAGRVYEDGRVESGFALLEDNQDFPTMHSIDSSMEAITLFKNWSKIA